MKVQVTTGAGTVGLTAAFNKLMSLFGSYTFAEWEKAFSAIEIQSLGICIGGFVLSLIAIFYNEDKNEKS